MDPVPLAVVSPRPGRQNLQSQTLLFDADDTLWENNIYFERAIAAFISYLDHRVYTSEEVREHLNLCERATIAEHGYGVQSFRRSLIACFEQLSDAPATPELRDQHHARIGAFTESISTAEIEVLPGVESTLRELAQRHRLILVTKGNLEEQADKVERSGLRGFFTAIEVLPEKNAAAYRDLLTHHSCGPATTWMIGNSPRSDINPSLAAGLNAVFIPHDFTWVLEHEIVDGPAGNSRLLELQSFAELLDHF
jgi:putative hydrolase of the HAD superfamily